MVIARSALVGFATCAMLASCGWSQVLPSLDDTESHSEVLTDVESLPYEMAEPLDDTSLGSYYSCHGGINRDPGHPAKPKFPRPGDINRGDCPPHRYRMDGAIRAGFPQHVAPWARCSSSPKYSGGFVGGGAAFCGRARRQDEGTWGVDYQGHLSPRRVFLNWTCGRDQGGEGAYRTDGEPKVVSAAKEHIEAKH